MMRLPDDSIKRVAAELERTGHVVIPAFLGGEACAELAAECRALHELGQLLPAATGRGPARRHHAASRGDRTHWFEAAALTAAQAAYWQAMQILRVDLNRSLLFGLEELEAHYALYPSGTRYVRHRDRFRDDDARVLSSVLYLNADWRGEDGGQLRLYLAQNTHVDIYPEAGTLVLFLSAEFEHEVLPATRERVSIAGWFRRRS